MNNDKQHTKTLTLKKKGISNPQHKIYYLRSY